MIEITVNGEYLKVNSSTSISTLLQDLGIAENKGVALAVNEEVVPKSQWNIRVLSPEDRIIIIKATAGG